MIEIKKKKLIFTRPKLSICFQNFILIIIKWDLWKKIKFHCARKEKYRVFVLEMSSSELTDISVCAVMLYSRRLSTLGFARLHPTVLTRDSVSLRMGRVEQGDSGGKKAKEKEKNREKKGKK